MQRSVPRHTRPAYEAAIGLGKPLHKVNLVVRGSPGQGPMGRRCPGCPSGLSFARMYRQGVAMRICLESRSPFPRGQASPSMVIALSRTGRRDDLPFAGMVTVSPGLRARHLLSGEPAIQISLSTPRPMQLNTMSNSPCSRFIRQLAGGRLADQFGISTPSFSALRRAAVQLQRGSCPPLRTLPQRPLWPSSQIQGLRRRRPVSASLCSLSL